MDPINRLASSRQSKLSRRTSSISTSSDRSSSLPSSSAGREKGTIQWETVLKGASVEWKWLEDVRNFSVYTKQINDSQTGHGCAVLAIGTVRGSVAEVASLLCANSQDDYDQRMTALHGSEFKHGVYMDNTPHGTHDGGKSSCPSVAICSATFTRWHGEEKWSYLQSSDLDASEQRFTTVMRSLHPDDVVASRDYRRSKFGEPKLIHDVVAGYQVEPNTHGQPRGSRSIQPQSVRVHFYGEFAPSRSDVKGMASAKAIKQRLVQTARDCDRLTGLVRRRRLGFQQFVDRRFVLPHTNVTCANCDRVQLLAKPCRLCDRGVCSDCSSKYDLETVSSRRDVDQHGTLVVRTVRICDPCLACVETANYSPTHGAAVPSSDMASEQRAESTPCNLQALLQAKLLEAPTTKRTSALVTVIRSLLDDQKEQAESAKMRVSKDRMMLAPLSEMDELVNPSHLLATKTTSLKSVENGPTSDATHSSSTGTVLFSLQESKAPHSSDSKCESDIAEALSIICAVATRETDASGAIITILTPDNRPIVASNLPELSNTVIQREEWFCRRTIMTGRPLIVSNPKTDVRISRILPVADMDLEFYFGFPISSVDGDTVVGTLSCVDQKKRFVTEAQFASMKRLAQTASRVVNVHTHRARGFDNANTGLLMSIN